MTAVKEHLSSTEREHRYKPAPEPIAKSHLHALWLLSRGYDLDETAEILSFSTRWVRILIKQLQRGRPRSARRSTGQQWHRADHPDAGRARRAERAPEDAAGRRRPVDGPEDRALAREVSRAQIGPRPARLGCAHRHRLLDPAAAPTASGCGNLEGSRPAQKKLQRAAAAEQRKHPDATIEVWATDEHRIGLKPITRGVWAPVGERPLAIGHHRFEWLYVTGFVEPATGRTVWNVSNGISKAYFELLLADFAKSGGAGSNKRIVLQLDNAGWHGPENLAVPDGIRLVFQPAHSPELQPAEHLWAFLDEPLVNRYFETIEDLDQMVGEGCLALLQQTQTISASTLFHWWRSVKARKSQ